MRSLIKRYFWGVEERGVVKKFGLYHVVERHFGHDDLPSVRMWIKVMESAALERDREYVYTTLRDHCYVLELDYWEVRKFYKHLFKLMEE